MAVAFRANRRPPAARSNDLQPFHAPPPASQFARSNVNLKRRKQFGCHSFARKTALMRSIVRTLLPLFGFAATLAFAGLALAQPPAAKKDAAKDAAKAAKDTAKKDAAKSDASKSTPSKAKSADQPPPTTPPTAAPAADAARPAAAEYQKVLEDWKTVLKDLRKLKLQYQSAALADQAKIQQDWKDL